MAITLPEITIEGSPDKLPENAADWFSDGFIKGFNAPTATPDRPMLLNDELTATFFQGVTAGKDAAASIQADFESRFADQAQIGPDLGGETLEAVQKRFNEEFGSLFEKEDPHTENDTEVLDPLPPTFGLVE